MTRSRAAVVLARASGWGFLVVAALHGSAYGRIMAMAETAPEAIRRVLSVLWLSGSADLVAFGLVIIVVARGPGGAAVIGLCALSPLAVAVLQIVFLGFVPPTAMLLALAGLTVAAAVARRGA